MVGSYIFSNQTLTLSNKGALTFVISSLSGVMLSIFVFSDIIDDVINGEYDAKRVKL